jgi:transposase-like protein
MAGARVFRVEFRIAVARRILNGESVSALSNELKIKRSVLYRWRDAHRDQGAAGLSRPKGRPSGAATKPVSKTSAGAQFDAQYSPDGKRIAFASLRSGLQGVWISSDDGSNLVQISNPDAINPRESLDGKKVYFASNYERSTLKQAALPAQPGTESEVDGLPRLNNADLWTLSLSGIYFVPAEAPKSLRYFDFATRQIRPIFEADKDFAAARRSRPMAVG